MTVTKMSREDLMQTGSDHETAAVGLDVFRLKWRYGGLSVRLLSSSDDLFSWRPRHG